MRCDGGHLARSLGGVNGPPRQGGFDRLLNGGPRGSRWALDPAVGKGRCARPGCPLAPQVGAPFLRDPGADRARSLCAVTLAILIRVRMARSGVLRAMALTALGGALTCGGLATSCRTRPSAAQSVSSAPAPGGSAPPQASTLSSVRVSHGELDTPAPDHSPKLAATVIATTIYKQPNTEARRLGYIRLGGVVERDRQPVSGIGCKGEWYRVYPMGYVCTDQATVDLEDPVVRAAEVRPDLAKPLPYRYGFVRATAPQYLRIPTKQEQVAAEFQLEDHLRTFAESRREWQSVTLGANDIPLDARGLARPGLKPPPGFRPATEWSELELYGGERASKVPWWLEGGRKIPNVSGYDAPSYAVFADRVRRKTGLSFVRAFATEDQGLARDFGVTVDLRLVPTSKVKPDSGSPFHGVELTERFPVPFAFVVTDDATTWRLLRGKDEVRAGDRLPRRAIVPLSGRARIKAGQRFYQTQKDRTVWLRASDLGIVAKPATLPSAAEKGEKWIDISLRQQTLVLYEGKRAWYATLVSTGRDRLGDPETSLATPRGEFRLLSKHIAAAMDSEENSTVAGGTRTHSVGLSASDRETIARLERAEKEGQRLSEEDQRRLLNIKKGRRPEYGVTERRGAANFELRDVPWIQYFAKGYALHGAYWHDVFGVPRSHGCVNLSPIDARIVFNFTDPPVPAGWHGVNIGEDMGQGTVVVVHE